MDPVAGVEWRCFHCDEVFTDPESAAVHFGIQIDSLADEPGCKLNQTEGGILAMLREAQAELRRYHEEDHAMARTFHALGAEHHAALQRQEEKGYARGLKDAILPAAIADRIEQLEQALRTFSKASWEFRGHIDKWGRISAGDVSTVSANHHKALRELDALVPEPPK